MLIRKAAATIATAQGTKIISGNQAASRRLEPITRTQVVAGQHDQHKGHDQCQAKPNRQKNVAIRPRQHQRQAPGTTASCPTSAGRCGHGLPAARRPRSPGCGCPVRWISSAVLESCRQVLPRFQMLEADVADHEAFVRLQPGIIARRQHDRPAARAPATALWPATWAAELAEQVAAGAALGWPADRRRSRPSAAGRSDRAPRGM